MKFKNFESIKWIGFLPRYIYSILLAMYILLSCLHLLPEDFLGAIGILTVYSLALSEIGKSIPILKMFGGKVLVVTFLPSFLVYKGLIPKDSVSIIDYFMDKTNFLTLFIIFIVVGSMFGMRREVLLHSTSKIFLALITSQVVGALCGCVVALILKMPLKEAIFFVIVPVMAGGVGEGALPLSIGYSTLLGMEQGVAFARILPCVFMGGIIGVIYAGLLNQLGKKRIELTGQGTLVKKEYDDSILAQANLLKEMGGEKGVELGITAVVVSIVLYYAAIGVNKVIGLPIPIVVLLLVIFAKLLGIVPEYIEWGGERLYKFTVIAISPLLLFGVGVSMTPWENLTAVFSDWKIIVVLFSVVSGIVVTGFFMGRLTGLYEIDAAIVISCCSGQGGTGALAILAAGERMKLMPFAQVAVRIGGAIVVTIALQVLRHIA